MAIITDYEIGTSYGRNIGNAQENSIREAKVELTQTEILAGATPIDVKAAPGVGKVYKIIGAIAKLYYNGVAYGVASSLYISVGSIIYQLNSLVNGGVDLIGELTRIDSTSKSTENAALQVVLDNNATGLGGTITVWIQYMVKDVS